MSRIALAALIACGLLLGGCIGDARKPIPVVTVVVLPADDAYQFNGQQMTFRQVADELTQLADHNRREKGKDVRAIVRLASRPGVDYGRVRDVEEFCNSIGLDQIEKGY
jgi:biopolymer transport protein ExbD